MELGDLEDLGLIASLQLWSSQEVDLSAGAKFTPGKGLLGR
jgi:hypothetical protein